MAKIDWHNHQKKLNASSLSIRKYCDNNGLNYNTARNKLKKPKLPAGGPLKKKLKQKPRQTKPKEKKGIKCNLNAAKHFGYARNFASELLSNIELEQNDLNQEIAIARIQLLLVIDAMGKKPDDIEQIKGCSESIQRLLARLDSLINSQHRLDCSASSHGNMLENIFSARRTGEMSAIEAAYQFMEKGIDVPAMLQTEVKIELGEDEDDSDLPKGAVTPQIVEEYERKLREGYKKSAAEFLAERMAALEELNKSETKQN